MASDAATTSARRAPREVATGAPRFALRVVRNSARRTGRGARLVLLMGPVLVLLSLLAVVAAQALLTEGQVTLTNLESKAAAAQTNRFGLELKVASEEEPSAIVAAAKGQGMVTPAVVHDLTAVDPGPSSSSTTTDAKTDAKTHAKTRSRANRHGGLQRVATDASNGGASPGGSSSSVGDPTAAGTP